MKIKNLINKKIAILWFWLEWKSTLKFLEAIWIKNITILDKNIQISESNSESFIWIDIISWDKYLNNLKDFDIIIKSPWISTYKEQIIPHKNKITSQTQIFYDNYKWKIISVTATKGKSTTVSLIYELLKKTWFKAKLVWNIWKPVLEQFSIENNQLKTNEDFVVYELSSHMLDSLKKQDYISILWNIYREHIDWHKNFENYKKAKFNVLNWSQFSLIWYKVRETEEKQLQEILKNKKEEYKFFGWNNSYYSHNNNFYYVNKKRINTQIKTLLYWEHNLDNISSLFWICDKININYKIIFETIKNFKWLPYRLHNIWTYKWITFIDDSLSTNPHSTIESIKTFKNNIWTIFLWWSDREFDFRDLANNIEKYQVKNIVFFPDTWKLIRAEIDKIWYKTNFIETDSMLEAIKFAYKHCKIWEVALLSCASPSFSMYKNYKEKWDDFKEKIKTLSIKE